MKATERNHIVVGGGISGLLAALMLAESGRTGPVYLIEREPDIGGLLRCFDYGEFGRFDYGMHNMYETGVPGLDALLLGLLRQDEWQYLKGSKRDLAGLFFNGKLQHNSLYMDLRGLPRDDFEHCVAGFFTNLSADDGRDAANAHEYAKRRFGQPIGDTVVAPTITKLFRRDAVEMDTMAAMLTSIDRVILFDEPQMGDLMESRLLASRLAYTEQRNLPLERSSGRMGYYPRQYGMYRVIEAIRHRLLAAGVHILTGTQVRRVSRTGGHVNEIEVVRNGGTQVISGIAGLHWTAGLPALAPLLGIPLKGMAFDRPLQTIAVNFLLDRDPDMADLYYFYCYDRGFDTFRVTHFSNYCEDARRVGSTPVCVELLVEPADDNAPDYVAQALRELDHFGVLAPGTKTLLAKAEPLAYGFPMPTLRNVTALGSLRDQVAALELANLLTLGILAEPRLFFQKDVVAHTYERIGTLLERGL